MGAKLAFCLCCFSCLDGKRWRANFWLITSVTASRCDGATFTNSILALKLG